MPPVTSSKEKQFAFILSSDEHLMLAHLAEARGVAASEWLRTSIREAFARDGLEKPGQRLRRVWGEICEEHALYLAHLRQRDPKRIPPKPLVLKKKIREVVELSNKLKFVLEWVSPYQVALVNAETR